MNQNSVSNKLVFKLKIVVNKNIKKYHILK